jgi:hypothetical protein
MRWNNEGGDIPEHFEDKVTGFTNKTRVKKEVYNGKRLFTNPLNLPAVLVRRRRRSTIDVSSIAGRFNGPVVYRR